MLMYKFNDYKIGKARKNSCLAILSDNQTGVFL